MHLQVLVGALLALCTRSDRGQTGRYGMMLGMAMGSGRRNRDYWNVGMIAAMVLALAFAGYAAAASLTRTDTTNYATTYTPEVRPAFLPNVDFEFPADPRLLILGDSFTQGIGASDFRQGYAYQVGQTLGWDHRINGEGGTGFTWPGPTGQDRIYSVRIAEAAADQSFRPNLVILQGGVNDYRANKDELHDAVIADISEVQAAFPDAQVIVFGPVASAARLAVTQNLDNPISSAAAEERVPYLSPLRWRWITEQNSAALIDADGIHPTDAGHTFIAEKVVDFVRALQSRAS